MIEFYPHIKMAHIFFALWGVAWLLEARSPREALRVALMACLVGLTHVQGVAYFGLAMLVLNLRTGLLGTRGVWRRRSARPAAP